MIIAGTGHRPDKLGGYGQSVFDSILGLCERELSARSPHLIISGMALGFDQALAQAAINCGIPFHAYIPFESQDSRWPESSQIAYRRLLEHAAKVVCCSTLGDRSVGAAMQYRNERMTDSCDLLLALWNGTPGGTANCIKYALRIKRPIVNLWTQFKS